MIWNSPGFSLMSPWEVRSKLWDMPFGSFSHTALGLWGQEGFWELTEKGALLISGGVCPQEVPPGMSWEDRRAGPAPPGPPPQDMPQSQGNQQGHGFHGSEHAERGWLQ